MKDNRLSPQTIRWLLDTKAQILNESCAYNQGHYGLKFKPDCGSPACLIGWMMFFALRFRKTKEKDRLYKAFFAHAVKHGASSGYPNPTAMEVLGLTDEQFERLYWTDQWPFGTKPGSTGDKQQDAQFAASRIDRFIISDGAE